QLGEERVADDVAEPSLGVGHAHVERQPRRVPVVGGQLRAEEDEADLGAVAVGDDDAPAAVDEPADPPRGRPGVVELLGDRAALAVLDEGVAADRDHGRPGHRRHPPAPRRRPRSRSAASKQGRGARAMPAPICPTPASRWAMPVLITGATPLSTTRRRSMPVGVPAQLSAGSAYSAFRASVMSYIARVYPKASAGVPPTKRTMAGAPAMAKPPMPAVSVMALSPRSGLASAAL